MLWRILTAIAQEDEDGANWDPRIALQAGDYSEDGSAVLGVATVPMAEILGLDAAVRSAALSSPSFLTHYRCYHNMFIIELAS